MSIITGIQRSVVARGIVTGLTNCTVHQWQFSSIRSPLSLASLRCVPPLSCCYWLLLKFSALRKFTTTGAGYGLLTTSNPVGSIMSVWFRKLLTKIKAPRRCKVSRESVFYIYRIYQLSAFSARKDTLPTPWYCQCWKRLSRNVARNEPLKLFAKPREDKGDREGIPHTHPIP